MEPMDGSEGLEANVTSEGTLSIDENNSNLKITNLPANDGSSDIPSVVRSFREPVRVNALVVTLRSVQSAIVSSGTEEGSTSGQPTPGEAAITVMVTLGIKKQGDTVFSNVVDESTGLTSVSRLNPTQEQYPFPRTQIDSTINCLKFRSILISFFLFCS